MELGGKGRDKGRRGWLPSGKRRWKLRLSTFHLAASNSVLSQRRRLQCSPITPYIHPSTIILLPIPSSPLSSYQLLSAPGSIPLYASPSTLSQPSSVLGLLRSGLHIEPCLHLAILVHIHSLLGPADPSGARPRQCLLAVYHNYQLILNPTSNSSCTQSDAPDLSYWYPVQRRTCLALFKLHKAFPSIYLTFLAMS